MQHVRSAHDAPPPLALIAVGLLAGATLGLQIALTRHFSFLYWHHFAFMIIGIGMLGFGAAGAWLAWSGGVPDGASAQRIAAGAAVLASLAIVGYLWIGPRFDFEPLDLLEDPAQFLRLLAIYTLVLLPFTGLGLAQGSLLAGYRAHSHRVYGADLLGAGAGCWLAVGLLCVVPATTALLLLGAAAAAAGALLAARQHRAIRWAAWAVVALLLILSATGWSARRAFLPAPSKDIAGPLREGSDVIEYTASSPTLRIDVTRPLSLPFYFGGDVAWPSGSPIPQVPTRLVFQDGSAPTVLVGIPDPQTADFLGRTSQGLPYQIRPSPRVCIIGAGGGPDVLIALHGGAREVTAVELNPQMMALGFERYRDFTFGLFHRPEVTPVIAEGRHFLARTRGGFDVIQMSGVDTFAALAAGAYAMSENYLYTVEAGQAMLRALAPDGLVSNSRWFEEPPRETLRLVHLLAVALTREGAPDPARHLFVIRGSEWGTTLMSKRPFTEVELESLRRWATRLGFKVALDPNGTGERPFVDLLHGSAAERRAFVRSYSFDLSATTDDRPFFFQFHRWRNLLRSPETTGGYVIARLPVGYAVLAASLIQMTLLSVVCILGPLWLRRSGLRGQRFRARRLAFFTAIGAGFMGVEITAIQIFTVFLGAPVYSMAVTLSALLVATGAGAWWAGLRRSSPRRLVRSAVGAVGAWVALTVLLLRPLLDATIEQPLFVRAAIVALWLLPAGLALGVPLPTAVRALAAEAPAFVPWAWAANACASVVASLLVVLLSMQIGFRGSLLTAAATYAVAYVVWRPTLGPDPVR